METFSSGRLETLVVDLANMSCFKALAHDFSKDGCWIVSDRIDRIRDQVGLRISGVESLIHGTVVAYGDNAARVSFRHELPERTEKRSEIRKAVLIPAIVCGQTNSASLRCRIVDASLSGCRLEAENLGRLPDAIDIFIPDLDLPIPARIVWRSDGQAGVRLNWPFIEDAEGETPQALAERTEQTQQVQNSKGSDEMAKATTKRKSPKKRISAFGRPPKKR